jgi:hypothetical protein
MRERKEKWKNWRTAGYGTMKKHSDTNELNEYTPVICIITYIPFLYKFSPFSFENMAVWIQFSSL